MFAKFCLLLKITDKAVYEWLQSNLVICHNLKQNKNLKQLIFKQSSKIRTELQKSNKIDIFKNRNHVDAPKFDVLILKKSPTKIARYPILKVVSNCISIIRKLFKTQNNRLWTKSNQSWIQYPNQVLLVIVLNFIV